MKALFPHLNHWLAVLCSVALFSACATNSNVETDHSDNWQHTDLEGRSLAYAFEQLGHATIIDYTAPAAEMVGEFYEPVQQRFPPYSPSSRSVLIREVRWRHGDYYIAVLCTRPLGRWRVFDAIKWHKDLQF